MLDSPTKPDVDRQSPITGIGAVDCDVHLRSPGQADLMPYLDAYWRDMFPYRNIDHMELMSFPFSAKHYSRPGTSGGGASSAAEITENLLDPLKLDAAIASVVNGVHALHDPYLAAAMCQAINRWMVETYLDKEPRLRASLVVPFQNPEAAAEEVRRYANDKRFVQVLAICGGEHQLGHRYYWPIYRAAAEAGFALSIHPGSAYRFAPTGAGFFSSLTEDQVSWTQGFGNQIMSLLAEGVMTEYKDMKIVLAESGVSWLFGISWRISKNWRGVRMEIPWVKQSPDEIIQNSVRMTIQPFDSPPDPADGQAVIDCIGSPDMLLYASDYPHDYGTALGAWPEALPTDLATTIGRDNARATYPRLEV